MTVKNPGNIFKETVSAFLTVMEVYDPALRENAERIASNCIRFCKKLRLSKTESEEIYFAGLLHDIGMFRVPVDIYNKKEALTEEEHSLVRMHPDLSEKILSNISFLKGVLPVVRHHHEKFDGSGYPDGKKGKEIPYGARIVALAEAYDAIASGRPYKDKKVIQEVIEEVEKQAGKHFDPELVKEFVQFLKLEDAAEAAGQREAVEDKKEIIRKTINDIITRLKKGKIALPSLPRVVEEVQAAIDNPISTTDDIAKLIETDSVISLRLISIANSAVYRGADKIQTVSQAVPRLGLKQTKGVVVAIANKGLYQTDNDKLKETLQRMWLHALACAYASRIIGVELQTENVDNLFLMGLVHDIGKVLLFKPLTDLLEKTEAITMNDIMEGSLGVHCSLGGALLAKLGFSDDFVRVARMHNDEKFSEATLKYILIVSLANLLTRKIGYSLHDGKDLDLAETPPAKRLKLEASQLDAICGKVKKVMEAAASKF